MGPRSGATSGCLRRRLFVPDLPVDDEGPDGPSTFDWVPLDDAPAVTPSPRPRGRTLWLAGFGLALLLSLGAGGAALLGAGVAGGAVAWTLLTPADSAVTATKP